MSDAVSPLDRETLLDRQAGSVRAFNRFYTRLCSRFFFRSLRGSSFFRSFRFSLLCGSFFSSNFRFCLICLLLR